QFCILATFLGEGIFEGLNGLPEIVLDRARTLVRNQRNPAPEGRFGDDLVAELGGVADQGFEIIGALAALDESQDLPVVLFRRLDFLGLGSGPVVLVSRHEIPFAVAVMPAPVTLSETWSKSARRRTPPGLGNHARSGSLM